MKRPNINQSLARLDWRYLTLIQLEAYGLEKDSREPSQSAMSPYCGDMSSESPQSPRSSSYSCGPG